MLIMNVEPYFSKRGGKSPLPILWAFPRIGRPFSAARHGFRFSTAVESYLPNGNLTRNRRVSACGNSGTRCEALREVDCTHMAVLALDVQHFSRVLRANALVKC
jgi:hypothetical protein